MSIKDKLFRFPDGLLWKANARFSLRSRRAKYELMMNELSPDQDSKILDAGAYGKMEGNENYAPTNFLEKWYPFKENITALGVDDLSGLKAQYPQVETVRYDGKVFPFGDQKFDIAFSNAVIEHVGSRADQQLFLDELTRVSRSVFLTTPNRLFFVEPHTLIPFLHWLPQPVFRRICQRIGLDYWSREENLNALTPRTLKKMLKNYFPLREIQIKWSIFSPSIILIIK